MQHSKNEYEIRGKDGKLFCMCKESEEAYNPELITKNGSIHLQELMKKAVNLPMNKKRSKDP